MRFIRKLTRKIFLKQKSPRDNYVILFINVILLSFVITREVTSAGSVFQRPPSKLMKQYIVDAFTKEIFHGNQAAVCILDKWPDEKTMFNITLENNFSETAFAVKEGDKYHLRWFTPGGEIDLCGHATLATGFVVLSFYEQGSKSIIFKTLSGDLTVSKSGNLLEMEFPAYKLQKTDVTSQMEDALGCRITEAFKSRDLLLVTDDEETVRSLKPDLDKIEMLDGLLVHVTAKGKETDCVSRSFGPKLKIPEDPVCGSGHCHIIPYWAEKLGKTRLTAYQASKRGGTLYCRVEGEKIFLAGEAALFSVGELCIK